MSGGRWTEVGETDRWGVMEGDGGTWTGSGEMN